PAGLALFDYSKEEITTLNMKDLYADKVDRLRFRDAIEATGVVEDFEITYRKRDGTEIECLETATVDRADDGMILNYHGIIRDITEEKQAARERLKFSALQRELAIAHDIQQSLLPEAVPGWTDLDVICYSKPTREVGGDFYAYHMFELSAEGQTDALPHFSVAVGDVSGKGIPAALLMAVSLASFQSIVARDFTPNQLLVYLNQAIRLYTGATKQNCAFVYAELSPQADQPGTYHLRTANAGCMAPLVRRADGTVEWLEVFGLPLGVTTGSEEGYQEVTIELSQGDILVLTSDGVVEAQNTIREMWGFIRLEQAVAAGPTDSAAAMLTHLKTEVEAFLDTDPHDDLTIVVIRV
ncbi:MAG: SpoIIE family protein phosphatase, partial [Chloroflexota bacterium]